jgi:hypothetical protein
LPLFENLQAVDMLLLESTKPSNGLLSSVVAHTFREPDAEFRKTKTYGVWYDELHYIGLFDDPRRRLGLDDQTARSSIPMNNIPRVRWDGFDMRLMNRTSVAYYFDQVRDLNLTICNHKTLELDILPVRNLQKIMAGARRLETVCLAAIDNNLDFRIFWNAEDVWPSLREIEIRKSHWVEDEIDFARSFVKNHWRSLRKFVTDDANIQDLLNPAQHDRRRDGKLLYSTNADSSDT